MEFDLDKARINMIEQQIRPWDVLDQKVLDTIAAVPRENFVPAAWRNLAFADFGIPLGHGQVMMEPKLEGRMLQELEIGPEDRILEIGTGSGYVTACLARLGREVDSIEIHEDFSSEAAGRLQRASIGNASLLNGDASSGWDNGKRYDVIAVTGSLPEYQSDFEHSLEIGGRLFVIVGEAPAMTALLIRCASESEVTRTKLFETVLVPLENAVKPAEFVF
ncbi:MAG: protein-L-isoaspartate O-methyltransferase [Gammaproteobacteria bacterium]|jgi:protein-L-isoaspartate(D-aspartate) O-methyltransferase|nr:protein-L-isoaspartate O-methyltransferase [Gammaproteobacteria bacterium]